MTVLACGEWRTNGEMIADVCKLYVDLDEDRVLDVTYGQGNFWTHAQPRRFLASDLHSPRGQLHHGGVSVFNWDYRRLPSPGRTADVVVFDPPYVAMGGRETSTLDYTDEPYGMRAAPRTPAEVRADIAAGLAECERVSKRLVLVKAQDYISSGRLQPGTHWAISDALALGLRYEDRFEFRATSARPQPGGRRQVHARRNLSSLLVFVVPASRR